MKRLIQVVIMAVVLTVGVMADELSERLYNQSKTIESYILNNDVDIDLMEKLNRLIVNARGIVDIYDGAIDAQALSPVELKIIQAKILQIIEGNVKLIDRFNMEGLVEQVK